MGKGANYLNNNKGVFLQAKKEKQSSTMPMCQYAGGCKRSGCIYRHPTSKDPTFFQQSKEPCMAFLANLCAFDAKGCLKRHPPKDEADRLRAKYSTTKCRFGDDCKTKGCIYLHPSDEEQKRLQQQQQQQHTIAAQGQEYYYVGSNQTNLAWDNQCHFTPPPEHALYKYHMAQQHQQQQYYYAQQQQQQQQQHDAYQYYPDQEESMLDSTSRAMDHKGAVATTAIENASPTSLSMSGVVGSPINVTAPEFIPSGQQLYGTTRTTTTTSRAQSIPSSFVPHHPRQEQKDTTSFMVRTTAKEFVPGAWKREG